jgi:hypothetical protein
MCLGDCSGACSFAVSIAGNRSCDCLGSLIQTGQGGLTKRFRSGCILESAHIGKCVRRVSPFSNVRQQRSSNDLKINLAAI